MSDKAQIIIAIVSTVIGGIGLMGGWLNMSIGEVRADIREIRTDIRELRADIRENRAIAKADSDKNKDLITAHLTDHAAPESSEAE